MSIVGLNLKIVQLENELRARHTQVSALYNLLEQVQITLEEDDPDAALELLKDADTTV